MKKRKTVIVICTVILALCVYFFLKLKSNTPVSKENMTLIVKETVSPNKDYVPSEEDIVYFTVSVYQNSNHTIYVFADSSSPHYGNISYEVDCDHSINKGDVQITWTTLMGSTEASENDEIACAEVTITDDKKTVSKERINFFSKVIKTIADTIQ